MLEPDELGRVGTTTAQSASKAVDRIIERLAERVSAALIDDMRAALTDSATVPAMVLEILGSNPIARNSDARREYQLNLTKSAKADAAALGAKASLEVFQSEVETATDRLMTQLAEFKQRSNLSMAIDAKNTYQSVVTELLPQVQGGTLGYGEAVQKACKKLSERGVCIINYASGRRDQPDVAVRRHIQTQLRQAATASTLSACERLGVVLVEVSSHVGARPTHQEWQGQVYGLSGPVVVDGVKYKGFKESGAYDGLQEPNCRHSVAPYVPGRARRWSATPDKDAGLDPKESYNATQRQRYNERKIRAAKREALACRETGVDDTAARLRLGNAQRAQRQLLNQNKWLARRSERESVRGAQSVRGITSAVKSSERLITTKAKGTATDVARKAVNGKAYRAKFSKFDIGKKVSKTLYNQAKKILNECDATLQERMVVISAKTGQVITDTFSYAASKQQCGLAEKEYKKVLSFGDKAVIMHNHPTSSKPSLADLEALANNEWVSKSVIICHNGKIYTIESSDRFAAKACIESLYATIRVENPDIADLNIIRDKVADRIIEMKEKWLLIKEL